MMPFRIKWWHWSESMRTFRHVRFVLPLMSAALVLALPAQAQEHGQPPTGQGKPAAQTSRPAPARTGQGRPQGVRYARGVQEQNFGGHVYHGRLGWEGGRWRHEAHNGRYGWWWDVGGVWYFYPQPMEGPPAYVSDVEFAEDYGPPEGPPVGAGYPPPVAYAPPPPPPPPPPPDPAASAVGGAIIGGVLGGLLTGRPGGAAVGAIAGGTAGAIAGAQAAARPGYYLAQGNCYFRYPSGQYVLVDPRSCY
jgi:hypothetical protein